MKILDQALAFLSGHYENMEAASPWAMLWNAEHMARKAHPNVKRIEQLLNAALAHTTDWQVAFGAAGCWERVGDLVKERAAWEEMARRRSPESWADDWMERYQTVAALVAAPTLIKGEG
ncbi:MAG: hypothetical protein H0X24_18575 [Ktedonobacterales bacterium]|nr:hypothetical protein [Ktedonobacterales bacterium]